jgi:hypothetical protein
MKSVPGSVTTRAAGALSQYRAHLGDEEAGEVDAVNGAFMLCRTERSACSTRATGCSTWRTSTGATASGTPAGRSSTSRPAVALHVKGGSSDARRGLLNAAVYTGIGAKLATSLMVTVLQRRAAG